MQGPHYTGDEKAEVVSQGVSNRTLLSLPGLMAGARASQPEAKTLEEEAVESQSSGDGLVGLQLASS